MSETMCETKSEIVHSSSYTMRDSNSRRQYRLEYELTRWDYLIVRQRNIDVTTESDTRSSLHTERS